MVLEIMQNLARELTHAKMGKNGQIDHVFTLKCSEIMANKIFYEFITTGATVSNLTTEQITPSQISKYIIPFVGEFIVERVEENVFELKMIQ